MAKKKEEAKKVNNLREVFKYIKLSPLLVDFTTINPKGGVYHRINGKSTNVSENIAVLKKEEKRDIKNALMLLTDQVRKVAESIEISDNEV